MESTIQGSLDRKALAKRLESKRHELTARIRKAQADAASAASSHVDTWRSLLSDLENALEKGVDKLEDSVARRLDRALKEDDDDASPRPPA